MDSDNSRIRHTCDNTSSTKLYKAVMRGHRTSNEPTDRTPGSISKGLWKLSIVSDPKVLWKSTISWFHWTPRTSPNMSSMLRSTNTPQNSELELLPTQLSDWPRAMSAWRYSSYQEPYLGLGLIQYCSSVKETRCWQRMDCLTGDSYSLRRKRKSKCISLFIHEAGQGKTVRW